MNVRAPADDGTTNTTNVVVGNEGVIIQTGTHVGDVNVRMPERKVVVPRQLPASAAHFVGRHRELDRLTAHLDATIGTGPVLITAVEGTAGIGKTAFAIHWANQVKDRFPDGQLHINLDGFNSARAPVPAAVAVRAFLDALDVDPTSIPAELEAQAALFRSLVANRRILILLDNARDAAHIRPLLPGGGSCLVIVTSRSRLLSLAAEFNAPRVTLERLDRNQATTLLAARIGAQRMVVEADAVGALVDICARLPLALAIAAALVADRPDQRLDEFVTELEDERTRLDEFDLGELGSDLRAVFTCSYRTVSAPAARLFRLIGLHPGPDIGPRAVAALGALPARQARSLLTELVRANLFEENGGRYRPHDLLRVYARERAEADETAADRRAALTRVLDFYLHTGVEADHRLYPGRAGIVPAPADDRVQPVAIADRAAAMAWFTAEYACLIAAAGYAASNHFDVVAWQLPWAMHSFMDSQGHWYDSVATHQAAIAVADRLGDRRAQARMRFNIAHSYAQREHYAEAVAEMETARATFEDLGIDEGVAHAEHSMSWILARMSRPDDGLAHAERALVLHRNMGNRDGEAEALNTVSWLSGLLGDHQRDLECGLAALAMFRELGQEHHEALALCGIGTAYYRLGRPADALEPELAAVRMLRDQGDLYEEAIADLSLGDIHLALGDVPAAALAYRRAETVFGQLKQSKVAEARARLAGLQGAG